MSPEDVALQKDADMLMLPLITRQMSFRVVPYRELAVIRCGLRGRWSVSDPPKFTECSWQVPSTVLDDIECRITPTSMDTPCKPFLATHRGNRWRAIVRGTAAPTRRVSSRPPGESDTDSFEFHVIHFQVGNFNSMTRRQWRRSWSRQQGRHADVARACNGKRIQEFG